MSGIVFADTPQQGSQDYGQDNITSLPFFPEINLTDLRDTMRIDSNITSARLYHTAVEAVALVNSQLKDYRQTAMKRGITKLADTADDIINGQSSQEIRYQRAVYSYTKSLLLEKYADTDATGKTGTRAEAKQDQANDYRRDGHFAISDLLGRHRCDAELI